MNGERLNALSVDDLQYFETRFFLVPGTGTVYIDAKPSVIRQRAVADGFHEELTILNHADKAATSRCESTPRCDFADLFEVKDALAKKGKYSARVENGRLRLGYERGTFGRATAISATEPARFDHDGLTFKIRVDPHGEWTTELDVVTAGLGSGQARRLLAFQSAPRPACSGPRELARRRAPLDATMTHSRRPTAEPRRPCGAPLLAADRWRPSLPAAGLPWFMTMFGRDSIFTSLQALPSRRARRDDAARARRLAGAAF